MGVAAAHLGDADNSVMFRHVLTRTYCLAVAVSAILFVASAALYVAGFYVAYRIPPCFGLEHSTGPYLSFAPDVHACLSRIPRDGLDVRFTFFSDALYGPNRGSIIGIADEHGNIYPPLLTRSAFGDRWGIYWRYFEWDPDAVDSQSTLWTLSVSATYPLAGASTLPAIWMRRRLFRRVGGNAQRFRPMSR
jgi:hypothetical protein